MKKIITLILFVIMGIFTFSEEMGQLKIGDQLPNLKLMTLDGKIVNSDSYRGKRLFISFTATWCPYCQPEKKIFGPIYDKALSKENDLVVAVIFGDYGHDEKLDNPDKVKAYMKENNYKFPIFYDKGKEIAKQLGLKSVPSGILIDKNGKVIEMEHEFYKLPTFQKYAPIPPAVLAQPAEKK